MKIVGGVALVRYVVGLMTPRTLTSVLPPVDQVQVAVDVTANGQAGVAPVHPGSVAAGGFGHAGYCTTVNVPE